MKNVVCIIARTNSSRLGKKVLKEMSGLKMIEYIIHKMKRVKGVSKIYVCTSVDDEDQDLLVIAKENEVEGYAGSRESVIDRMLDVAKIEKADNVIRVTADNPFVDEVYLDMMCHYHEENKVDYTRTEYLPLGVTAEVISVEALKKCYSQMDPNESQYMMLYMFQPDVFKCQVLIPGESHQHPEWSLTVDTVQDWEKVMAIVENQSEPVNYAEILKINAAKAIDNLTYGQAEQVKFPANLMISYQAFRQEMDIRIEKSQKIFVGEEYNNYQHAQSN